MEAFDFYAIAGSKKNKPWFVKLSSVELVFYATLYKLIVQEPNVAQVSCSNLRKVTRASNYRPLKLAAVLQGEEDKDQITEWINKNVLVSTNTTPGSGDYFAFNLCHRAAKYNMEMVRFLLENCGADLSVSSLQIRADSAMEADVEPSESLFTMILNTFHEPVQFLSQILNTGVRQGNEDCCQSNKTFTFGELGRP